MKVREIKFVELETQYEGWQSRIEILFKESGKRYGVIGFDRAVLFGQCASCVSKG